MVDWLGVFRGEKKGSTMYERRVGRKFVRWEEKDATSLRVALFVGTERWIAQRENVSSEKSRTF